MTNWTTEFTTIAKTSWNIICDHWFPLMVALFIRDTLAVLTGCLTFALLLDYSNSSVASAVLAAILVGFVLQAGFLRLCLHLSETNTFKLSLLFSGRDYAMTLLFVCFSRAVYGAAGLLLGIAPGIVLIVRTCLADYIVVERRQLNALRVSNTMMKRHSSVAAVFLCLWLVLSWTVSFGAPLLDLFYVLFFCGLYLRAKSEALRE